MMKQTINTPTASIQQPLIQTTTAQKPKRRRIRLYDRIMNDPTILVA